MPTIFSTYFQSWSASGTTVANMDIANMDPRIKVITIDGVNANFNIAALCATGSVVVYKNGLRQNPGAGNDYTVNTVANPAVITFLTGNIPIAGTYPDVILVDYSA